MAVWACRKVFNVPEDVLVKVDESVRLVLTFILSIAQKETLLDHYL